TKSQLPHCCKREPVIVDLLPGAPYNMQVQNCCKAGVLSSINQDPTNSMASFQMNVETLEMTAYDFNIGVPGYTCGNATKVPPGVDEHKLLGRGISHVLIPPFVHQWLQNVVFRYLHSIARLLYHVQRVVAAVKEI
nr:COBRA-like protein 6 [Tanacetum cinerariifolium]